MVDVLFQNGDLVADKYGDIMSCDNEDSDVIQSANNNILLRFGGNKFHTNLGNKAYGRRIKANQNGIEMIQEECENAIINGDPRIREVKQVNVTITDDATCMVDYIVTYAKTSNTTDEDAIDVEEELVEIDGRVHINVFNTEGGE